MTYDPWQFPDHPFDYAALIKEPKGIGQIPDSRIGTQIAIIGAGCAGLCAAWELMKIGLHPIVYESDKNPDQTPRIGGRTYTWRFPGDPMSLAELGAMRVPAIHRTIAGYMDQFNIDYSQPFPDPLLVPTTLTCSHRAIETNMQVSPNTFSPAVWTALQNIHMTRSGKVFVRTRQAFWKDQPPRSTLTCTITDEAIRGTYLFDFEDTPSGVICLSYTWEDSATKLHALDEQERVAKSLDILKTIYGKDLISLQVAETKSYFWEHQKGYNGAFKLNYPGQYEDQQALFYQSRPRSMEGHNGVFLSGESASWAGGWIEGALHSGLDAALAVIEKLKAIPDL